MAATRSSAKKTKNDDVVETIQSQEEDKKDDVAVVMYSPSNEHTKKGDTTMMVEVSKLQEEATKDDVPTVEGDSIKELEVELFGFLKDICDPGVSSSDPMPRFGCDENDEQQMPSLVPHDDDDEELKAIKDWANSGANLRSKLGVQFQRDDLGSRDPEYVGSIKDKRAFRENWARLQLQNVLRSKTKLERLDNKKKEGGKFLSWKQLLAEEKDDVAAASLYAKECRRRGAPWIRVLIFGQLKREEFWYSQTEISSM